jgi:hypothetical protein
MMADAPITATISTEMSEDRLRAFVKQSTRGETIIELIAYDPAQVPRLSIFELTFSAIEDRDRFTIALRMNLAKIASAKHRSPA